MQPKTSSSAGWFLVILANLLIHLATALPPRANGLRAYRDESDDGAVREESVRHLDPIDGVHHFESEQEFNDFLKQMEERAKNTNGKWIVEYRRYSSHSDGAAGGGADGDVQTHMVDGDSALLNGASVIKCKRCTLKVHRVKNGEVVSGGGDSFVVGSTKTSSSGYSSSQDGRASMTAEELLRNNGEAGGLNREAGEVNRNVKVTKVVTTSTSGTGGYGTGGSMTVGDLMRNYGSTGESGSGGSGSYKSTKVVTAGTDVENTEGFDAEAALARADEILRKYQNGENVFESAGQNSRHVKVTKTVTTSTSGNAGYHGQDGSNSFVSNQEGRYGNTAGYGNSGSRNVGVTRYTTTKTSGSGTSGSFGTGRYSTSGVDELDALGNTGVSTGVEGSRNVKVTRVITTTNTGGSTGSHSGGDLTIQEGYGSTGDLSSSASQYNPKVMNIHTTGSYGSHEADDLLKTNHGSDGDFQVINSYKGTSGYNAGSSVIQTQGGYHGQREGTTYGSVGSAGLSGAEESSGITRKTVKITKSYWSGNTELGSLADNTENFDELKRKLDELISSGGFRDGKTVTTVTTTTSTNGGPPVVKTERYVKDGIDMKLNMDSLGTLDTAHNSIYGQPQHSHVLTHGANDGGDHASRTTRKTVKITKSYWKGDTQLGSFDGNSGYIDEDLRKRLEELRKNGEYENGKTVTTVTTTTSVDGGAPVVKTERYVKDGYDLSLDMKSLGSLDTSENSIYGQSPITTWNQGISGGWQDNQGEKTTKTTRKTVKITKSYWKGDTQLGSFDGNSGYIDEDLRKRLEELRKNGEYENGKTVTTVTTTTSVDGGAPVVKTERYVKDGYDLSLDMKSLGSLDTSENSIYGQSPITTWNQGISGGWHDNQSGKTTKTTRKTVKITKSYWKGDTQLGSFDGNSGHIDEDFKRRLEELRRNGEYANGKTVTTVTTTTSVDGGAPVVKTERYVKDGYDLSLDMDRESLGTLDTAENSIYGKSHITTLDHGTSAGWQDNHDGETTQTTRKTVKITKTFWKGNTQVGSFSEADHMNEDLKRRLEALKNDGDYVNGKTVTTVTTTTSTNGGPPVVKTERYVKDGFDTSINMDSFGTLDTSYKAGLDISQVSSSHGTDSVLDHIGENTSGSSRKTVKITKTYWKGSTQLGVLSDADLTSGDLKRRLEELIRNGEIKDGKTITTVTTTTYTNEGIPVVKTERYVKDGIDTSLHRDSFGSLDTSFGSTSDHTYTSTSSQSNEMATHGIGQTHVSTGGARIVGSGYGSTVHQGSTIADQMNTKGFRTVVVGGEIRPDSNERPTVIEALPPGPARHARPEVPSRGSGYNSGYGSGYGAGTSHVTHTSSVSEEGSRVPLPAIPTHSVVPGSAYSRQTYVSTHKTSQGSGSVNAHGAENPQLVSGGTQVVTSTDNSAKTIPHNAGQGSLSHSVIVTSDGSYGRDSQDGISGNEHDLSLSNSGSADVGNTLYKRPDGVPVVHTSYFNSGRKTSDSESSVLPGVSHTGSVGHNVVSSSTYTKHAESSSSGTYGSSSYANPKTSVEQSSSSEEDVAYHGPVPTPSPSIKIGYGSGVGGYGGSGRVAYGSYSQTSGTSYGGSASRQSGYNSGVKTVSPSSGYSSGSGYSGGGYTSGSSYKMSGSYGTPTGFSSSYGMTKGSHGMSSGVYGGNSGSAYGGSRIVSSYGADDCVEAAGDCRQSSEEVAGSVRNNPSYSYSQSWGGRSSYGRFSGRSISGVARTERFSQNENPDCEDDN